ncbi:MAG: tetratricopeptide repeat protein [candidate division WOR-3 bacterium]|nr:tetratricopeptide repeat protein [candidate division WOR-3 bacterium]
MPNCPKCNSFIREGQKFCTKCGVNLVELAKPKTSPELAASVDIQEKKIAQDSLNPKLYIKLGDTYRDYKFYEEALVQYQKAVSIDETNAEAHLKSADMYYSLRKLERAKDTYEKILKLQPDSLEVKINLFSLLKEMNLVSRAIELGKEIIKVEPKNLLIHKGLKEIFLRQGMEKEAIEELKTIIALEPLEKEAYKQLSEIYEKKKENDKAFESYKMVLGLGAEDKDALFFVGNFLYENGKYDEAIKYLEELLALDSTNMSARIYLAFSYLKKENLEKAIRTVDAIDSSVYWELSNKDKLSLAEIYFTLGYKYLQTNNLENAEANLQKSLKIYRMEKTDKELAKVYTMKADTVFADERFNDAKALYEKALGFDKSNAEYQEKLSKVRNILTSKRKKTTAAILVPLAVVAVLVAAFFVWRHFTTGLISINYNINELTRIEIDGTAYSTGFIRLKKGEHEIVVKGMPGYADTNLVYYVPGGKKIVFSLSLEPLYGSLKINSNPSGAEVWLDDELFGNTPLTLNEIFARPHSLVVKKGGYKKWDTVITVNHNRLIDLGVVHLKNLAGLWKGEITSTSPPSEFSLNIKQQYDSLFIDLRIIREKKEKGSYYVGQIKGKILGNNLNAKGKILDNYWGYNGGFSEELLTSEVIININGVISDEWNRLEGTMTIDFSGKGIEHWWVEQQKLGKGLENISLAEVKWKRSKEQQMRKVQATKSEITQVQETKSKPSVLYQSHVANYGWQNWKVNGEISGTTGQSRQMEAIKIKIENLQGSVKYRVNAADIGWMDWVKDGQVSGTTGQSRRLEAIQIELTGCPGWTIQYRVHVQDIGWMDWVREGQTAGTTGQSKRLEAIQIKLVSR